MKTLIIQQKMIGDVLTSSILFEALRKEYPKAELHYLIYKHTLPVVVNNPFIDRVLIFEEENNKPSKFYHFLKEIKREKYDIIIDVYSKIGTAILTASSGAEITVSYDKWYTRQLYTHTISRECKAQTDAGLAIENRLKLLSPIITKVPKLIKPKIYLTDCEIEQANEMLQETGISSEKLLLMISVLGSSGDKTYPHEYLAILLDQIVEETGAQLLFNYIPKQLEEAKRIFRHCRPVTQKHIYLDLFGKSLREFMALTSLCDALIGNEGGAVNMAKALNVPTFAVFSPAIRKEDWNLFQNESNISVHLKDFKSELFPEESKSSIQKRSAQLYKKFKPEYISDGLRKFLRFVQERKKSGEENV